MEFILSSNDAELLMAFEANPSLESLAGAIGRDPTVVSRQLKRIAESGDFLTKVSGRWKLTEMGMAYNQASRDYLLAQSNIVKNEVHLTIGTTREFCSKILAFKSEELKKALQVHSLKLVSFEKGVEEALLNGHIDLAIECGRPYSPDVAYKEALEEPIAPVIASVLKDDYKDVQKLRDLEKFPHVLCDRLVPEQIYKKKFILKNFVVETNDIATAKNMCLDYQGWALLPIYTISNELKDGRLSIINPKLLFCGTKFGAWYFKPRVALKPYYKKLLEWLLSNPSLLQ